MTRFACEHKYTMLLSQDSCCKLCPLLVDSILCNEKVAPLWTCLTFLSFQRIVTTETKTKDRRKYTPECVKRIFLGKWKAMVPLGSAILGKSKAVVPLGSALPNLWNSATASPAATEIHLIQHCIPFMVNSHLSGGWPLQLADRQGSKCEVTWMQKQKSYIGIICIPQLTEVPPYEVSAFFSLPVWADLVSAALLQF